MDWLDPPFGDPIEKREEYMSSLAGFTARMHKQAANTQGETTPGSEVYGGKHPR